MKDRITLKEAIKFHGHLGPYLVLGILSGEFALRKLKAKKYFGLSVRACGVNKKPRSCFIDGLQLSTGATYGKGNIERLNGSAIKAEFFNYANQKRITLTLKNSIIRRLKETKSHKDSEILAKELYKTEFEDIFNLITNC